MKNSNSIPNLSKSLVLIETVIESEQGLRTSELAERAGFSTTSCYRAIKTCEAAGWLQQVGDGWTVGARLHELGERVGTCNSLEKRVEKALATLAAETELSAKYSVREGAEALTRLRVDGAGEFAMTSRVGARFPLTIGSSGAALLVDASEEEVAMISVDAADADWRYQGTCEFFARVAEARKADVCRDTGSHHPSVHSLSAVVRDDTDSVVGAISLIGLPEQFADMESLTRRLQNAVSAIEESS